MRIAILVFAFFVAAGLSVNQTAAQSESGVRKFINACGANADGCSFNVGYISAYLKSRNQNYCPPNDYNTMLRPVHQWLRNHPNTHGLGEFDGIQAALLALYPC